MGLCNCEAFAYVPGSGTGSGQGKPLEKKYMQSERSKKTLEPARMSWNTQDGLEPPNLITGVTQKKLMPFILELNMDLAKESEKLKEEIQQEPQ